ncbi:hypothetical protein DFR67_103171 [Williamsia limnetica]|uniref:Uncharacterized protein n=1 Tax=Williamsia limnetica TaxID=882452 RepID=A0A318RRE7_WILLI|nr:hypothetical protein [Williamsia limnetica]PYE19260.1 hypothetical protein DFR67_103171 [Williamsia limnetica]
MRPILLTDFCRSLRVEAAEVQTAIRAGDLDATLTGSLVLLNSSEAVRWWLAQRERKSAGH